MSNTKKITLTLSATQFAELERVATEQGTSVQWLIMERFNRADANPTSSLTLDLASIHQNLKQLSEQIVSIQKMIEGLSDRPSTTPTSSDPQARIILQPVLNRLQQLEQQIGVIGSLTQQNLGQTQKGQNRIEAWLEALQVLVEPLLLDYQTEAAQQERKGWINRVLERLNQHLETQK